MNFAEFKAQNRAPTATLVLPLNVFADEFPMRPDAPVCVGLRLLSEDDRRKARKVAEDQATELHPVGGDGWVECFNDAVKRQVAALAMCDPNDATKPTTVFPYAEDQVLTALTVHGTQFIFDAVEQHEIDASPLMERANDATLARLAALLPLVDTVTINGRLSRRLSAMLEELEELVGDQLVEPSGIDDAGDEVPIVIGKR